MQIVLEGLGVVPSKSADAEAAALQEVQSILQPHMGVTWPTGNPNNRT